MNQDQVKDLLLRLDEDVEEFQVIFSGKTSKKANGVYHADTREIIIHNRNFDSDGELIYTAIHEFAHHLHFTRSPVPVGSRAHTVEFRSIFHELLERAEYLKVYANPIDSDPELRALSEHLRSHFLSQNGRLMKEFGHALIEAEALCAQKGARFEDFVERALALDRSTARTLMKIDKLDVNPDLGYENMATVASLPTAEKRTIAQEQFASGASRDSVRQRLAPSRLQDQDPTLRLEKERSRIKRTIQSLQAKLQEIEARLSNLDMGP